MTSKITKDSNFNEFKLLIQRVLRLENEEVTPDSNFFELGGGREDILDLLFEISQSEAFKFTTIKPEEVSPRRHFTINHNFTEEDIKTINESMPLADKEEFNKNPCYSTFKGLFTIGYFFKLLESKMN